jgi:outer membrane protein assembly factor BamB
MSVKWHYAPTAPVGKMFEAVYRAVAQSDAAYLGWMATDPPYTGTTALDRIDASGAKVWTWDSGSDTNLGNWPTIATGFVAVNDDGLYLLDPANGMALHNAGVDWWGQTIADAQRLYVVNQMQADGPGLLVCAVDSTTMSIWKQNVHQECGHGWGDVMGGLALDAGVLFYAPQYVVNDPDAGVASIASGVFAFDAATGTPKWNKPTTPASAISAGGGRVYLVEPTNELVARSQTDGAIAWTANLAADGGAATAGSQAPVLAMGLAIVATSNGIKAYDAATGTLKWTSPVIAPAYSFPSAVGNGCGGTVPQGGARVTSMAAALASGLLVVTANDGAIKFVDLATGADKGAITRDGGFVGAHDPVIVGKRLYVVDATGLVALE